MAQQRTLRQRLDQVRNERAVTFASSIMKRHTRGKDGPSFYAENACSGGCGNWPCDAATLASLVTRRPL